MNIKRIWAIAHNVFRETLRDKILYLIFLYVGVMLAAVTLLPDVAVGAEVKIVMDVGLAAMTLIGGIVAIFIGTTLVNREIEQRTIHVLVAKPLTRAEMIVGKHTGMAVLLSVLLAIATPIYLGFTSLLTTDLPYGALLVAIGFIYLELLLIVGMAILFGSFTSSILATLFTVALYVAGNLSRVMLQLGDITNSAWTQRLVEGLYLILPDLARLNLKNGAVYGQLPPPADLALAVLYGISYTVVLLVLAATIFSRRQL